MKSSFGSRVRRAMLRILLRSWAGVLIVILTLLAGLTAVQMWRGGLFLALSLLPQFVTNLILIAAVIAVRHVIHLWESGRIRELLLEGLMQGQTALKTKVEDARGTLSSLSREVKEELDEIMGGGKPAQASVMAASAPRCPSCNRFVRAEARFCDGCGAALPARCPSCGRPIRAGAKFCDGCGKPIGGAT